MFTRGAVLSQFSIALWTEAVGKGHVVVHAWAGEWFLANVGVTLQGIMDFMVD